MNATTTKITASELKYRHQGANPASHFFDRKTMRFFGDTMANYGVRVVKIDAYGCGEIEVYELYRRRAVKHGLKSSHYFHPRSFDEIHVIK